MRRLVQTAAAFLAVSTLAVFAQSPTLSGKWEARFIGTQRDQPKTFSVVELEFKVEGGRLTGTGRAGSWPGVAPISNGVIKGDHISFTMIGTRGSTSGFPKLDFDGTLQGDKLSLTLTYGYVDVDPSSARRLVMEAKKISGHTP